MTATEPRLPLRPVLALWRSHARRLLGGALLTLAAFASGIALLGASGLRLVGTGAGLVLASAVLLRLLGVLRVSLRYAERMATHDAMFRALADTRLWFFRRLAASAAGGIGFRRSGDLLSRLVGDVEALDGLYLRILLPLGAACVALPILLLAAGRWNLPLAAVLGLLFAVSAFLLPAIAAAASAGHSSRLALRAAALRVAVLDLAGGLREIRAFDAGDRATATVRDGEAALLSDQDHLARHAALAGAAVFLCQQAAVLAVLLALAGLAFAPLPPIPGTLLLFVLLAVFELTGGLARAGILFGHVAASARRVLAVGAPAAAPGSPSPPAPVAPGPGPVSGSSHALSLDSVAFRWRPDRPPVFSDLSMRIPEGAHVALLGPSGAGKSTLVALLLRVIEPDSGGISLGGVPLAAIDPAACRRRFAWLGQDTHLFSDTVRANLLLGRPDATEPELWEALDGARLEADVRALPDGLDTWLGESGIGLSGGQSRRLALARALLSRAPVLVLDEPAAGLDAAAEQELMATLNAIGGNRTLILIVHRLTGVERLDRAWHLVEGRASPASA